jgi:hypothetical protein
MYLSNNLNKVSWFVDHLVHRTVSQCVCMSICLSRCIFMCITGMWSVQYYAVLGAKWIRLCHSASPSISLSTFCIPLRQQPPHAFMHYSGKQSHLLCYPCPATPPPWYGTSTPAPTPFLSDKPPTNDTYVRRWLFNNAVHYRDYIWTTI